MMKTYIGTVKGQEITTNRDGENPVRMLVLELSEADDLQTIQQFSTSGDDTAPVIGDQVVVVEISESYKVAIAIKDLIDPVSTAGEKTIYSQDGGAVQAFITFKVDGQLLVNGEGDFAVRYTELETAFNQLQSDFDNLITAYNAHIHITTATVGATPTPGVIAPTTSTGSPSTADITPAKVETVELPS